MAEYRARAPRQTGGHPAPAQSEPLVTDGGHATMQAGQPPGGDLPGDGRPRIPERRQLT